jgi:hypothetical protein
MSKAIPLEVVTSADLTQADLSASAERINSAIHLIQSHEGAFEEATLEHRLIIGLEICKAQQVFGLSDPGQRNALGLNQHSAEAMPTVGKASPPSPNSLGFAAWLQRETPDLKRTTAQRYSTAFQSLGLAPDAATPAKIREKIKTLRHAAGKAGQPMPTLAALYKLGKPKPPEGGLIIQPPPDSATIRLQDAREAFHIWKEEFETMLRRGVLDDLDKPGLLDLKEFIAGARDRINTRLK